MERRGWTDRGAISEGDGQDKETPSWEEVGLGPLSLRQGPGRDILEVAGHAGLGTRGRWPVEVTADA